MWMVLIDFSGALNFETQAQGFSHRLDLGGRVKTDRPFRSISSPTSPLPLRASPSPNVSGKWTLINNVILYLATDPEWKIKKYYNLTFASWTGRTPNSDTTLLRGFETHHFIPRKAILYMWSLWSTGLKRYPQYRLIFSTSIGNGSAITFDVS